MRTIIFCNGNPEMLALMDMGYSEAQLHNLNQQHGIPADIALAMIQQGLKATVDQYL